MDEKDVALAQPIAEMFEEIGQRLDRERAAIRVDIAPLETEAVRLAGAGDREAAARLFDAIEERWGRSGFGYERKQASALAEALRAPLRSNHRASRGSR